MGLILETTRFTTNYTPSRLAGVRAAGLLLAATGQSAIRMTLLFLSNRLGDLFTYKVDLFIEIQICG